LTGKVVYLEQEVEDDKFDVARDIVERPIGVLQDEVRLLDLKAIQLQSLLNNKRKAVLAAEAVSSASSHATDAMRIEKDGLTREIAGLQQQLHEAQLSLQPIASVSITEIDRLRKEKTEAIREATDLKKKLRVADKMTENAKSTRQREVSDSMKEKDKLTETIAVLRSQLKARDDELQTAKSAFSSKKGNIIHGRSQDSEGAATGGGRVRQLW
jgi:predicted  nucleic acid-binding Zn-ribbon protein